MKNSLGGIIYPSIIQPFIRKYNAPVALSSNFCPPVFGSCHNLKDIDQLRCLNNMG